MIANWLFSDGETNVVVDAVSGNNLNLTQVVEPGFTPSVPTEVIGLSESASDGTVVATLDTVDVDTGDTFTYTVTNDPSGFFEIVGNEVRVKAGATLDHGITPSR